MKRYAIYATMLVGIFGVSVAMKDFRSHKWDEEDYSKFLKFSHTFHVKEQSVGCEDCHQTAKGSTHSSDNLLGSHESCTSCHEEQLSANCGYCHTDPDNIEPIKNPERELLFSHELHASKHQLACGTCHGGVDTVAYATSENMPSMVTCVGCHTTEQVSTNCETCHTDFAGLVPADHLAGDFRKDHKQRTRLGELELSCATCHTERFCQDCHTGIELQGFGTSRDLMTEPASRGSAKDSPKQLKLQQAHELNYRFTHGIEARSKLIDCSSCHERQSFCVTCHEAGGNITQQKIQPENHSEPGFTTLGRGSGGGRHAELARRYIETCVSCHDVQGRDPVCMLCHTEGGGVR